jgi:hypothetical protein
MERMATSKARASALSDVKIPVRFKLSALWTAVMLCYIYGDIFSLFKPGTVRDIAAGNTGFLGTQGGLFASALLMAIPSVMVALSILLAPTINRYANIALGILYTVVILATLQHAWAFYIFLGIVEAALTLSIAWIAWRWPRTTS